MKQQSTITRETAQRGHVLYAHELKEGDKFCASLAQYRQRIGSRVISNEFREVHSEYRGKLIYSKGYHGPKCKTYEIKNAMSQVVFLSGE